MCAAAFFGNRESTINFDSSHRNLFFQRSNVSFSQNIHIWSVKDLSSRRNILRDVVSCIAVTFRHH